MIRESCVIHGATELSIGGITPMTTIDFPGRLAAVLFCQGCPWRCRYCHNTHLLPSQSSGTYSWQSTIDFLKQRIGLLDGVVFSGGEPCSQKGLAQAMGEVKKMGFDIALHTGGANPQRIAKLLPLLDWVGFDVKASTKQYSHITQIKHSGEKAWQSLQILLDAGIPVECRTTVHWDLLSIEDIDALAESLHQLGVKQYALQICRPENCLDENLGPQPLMNGKEMQALKARLENLFDVFTWRSD